jgi:intein-encoded DNA endonuclease-like protein
MKYNVDKDLVIEKYKELSSTKKVAELLNVSNDYVYRLLKRNNVTVQKKKYFVNENYFDVIDSEEKAYWYGFLCADGYIRERKISVELGLKLCVKDLEHLELFKKHIGSTNKIYSKNDFLIGKDGEKKYYPQAHLAMYSKGLVESIKKQGFHTTKTFTISAPTFDKKFYRDFIRGYFDGDGCCYIRKGKSPSVTYSMTCASNELRKFIMDELERNSIRTIMDNQFVFYIPTVSDSYKFFNYLYNDSKIYLKRKKDKGEIFVNYQKTKKFLFH